MPDLNCTEFEARLMQAVEDRESLNSFEDDSDPQSAIWQELRARANACPHCRKLWNEFALLERVLPVWKSQLPPVDLADRVLARWREEQTASGPPSSASKTNGRKKSAWRFPFNIVLAVAVAVLAAIPFVFRPASDPALPEGAEYISHEDPETVPDVTVSVSDANASEEPKPDADWQALAQDARSAYWALASDAADSFASVAVFVPARKTATEVQTPKEPEAQTGWVEDLGSGLKPIGRDVKKSMGFLFDALPTDAPTI